MSSSASGSGSSYTMMTAASGEEEIVLKFTDVKAWVTDFPMVNDDGEAVIVPRRDILRGVSGTLKSGQMTMCAGASGAGKSTLLDILSSRATSILSSGHITLNGEPFGLAEFQAMSAYVTQDAIFLNSLTPHDILTFRAKMLLPASMSAAEKAARVDDVIELLSLDEVRHVQLGEPGVSARGLNFVQRKRLNIAASLLSNPRILFVDEPTTGLDAAAARLVMLSLKRVAAQRNLIIFATLHQPSVFVFNLFDKALVMALGQMAYEGPVAGVDDFMRRAGYPCPEQVNPADQLILMLDSSDGDTARVQAIIDAQSARVSKSSTKKGKKKKKGGRSRSPEGAGQLGASGQGPLVRTDRVSWLYGLWTLVLRNARITINNEKGLKANVGQSIGFGVLIGILYNLDNSQAGAQDRVGVIFLVVVNALFLSLQASTFVFISEQATYRREVADGLYSLAQYAISKLVSEAILQSLYQILFALIMYWWSGLRADFDVFLLFIGVMCLVAAIGGNMGLTLSAFSGDAGVATSIAPLIIMPMMLSSGVLVSKDTMPVWLRWLREVSIVRYAFEALLQNETEGQTYYCKADELGPSGVCPITSGAGLVASRTADETPSGIAYRVGILAAFVAVTAILACVGLVFSTWGDKTTQNSAATSKKASSGGAVDDDGEYSGDY